MATAKHTPVSVKPSLGWIIQPWELSYLQISCHKRKYSPYHLSHASWSFMELAAKGILVSPSCLQMKFKLFIWHPRPSACSPCSLPSPASPVPPDVRYLTAITQPAVPRSSIFLGDALSLGLENPTSSPPSNETLTKETFYRAPLQNWLVSPFSLPSSLYIHASYTTSNKYLHLPAWL